jgi:hypothetical protein
MLRDHGLDANLNYVGVDVEVKKAEEEYIGQIVEFKLKNSSMNTFKKVLERVKDNLKLNAMDTIQYNYYKELNENVKLMDLKGQDLKEYYESELKSIKGQLFNIRLRNVMIKLAFINSELKDAAMDDGMTYKDLTISLKEEKFTK